MTTCTCYAMPSWSSTADVRTCSFIANQAVPASEASPPWHLARISQHALLPKRLPAFRYNATAGKGVDVSAKWSIPSVLR